MSAASPHTHDSPDPAGLAALGGWLFTWRTAVPLPLVVALLVFPAAKSAPWLTAAGAGLIAAGELIRLWGVRQIGAISRTRSDRLGPLVASGPFAYVRNPLYLGNISLWTGFALIARLPYLVPFILLGLFMIYHAIVRWEERLLDTRLGVAYREYAQRVPRWLPRPRRTAPSVALEAFSWRDTIFSERGTLIAIAAGFGLLLLKAAVVEAVQRG